MVTSCCCIKVHVTVFSCRLPETYKETLSGSIELVLYNNSQWNIQQQCRSIIFFWKNSKSNEYKTGAKNKNRSEHVCTWDMDLAKLLVLKVHWEIIWLCYWPSQTKCHPLQTGLVSCALYFSLFIVNGNYGCVDMSIMLPCSNEVKHNPVVSWPCAEHPLFRNSYVHGFFMTFFCYGTPINQKLGPL